MHPYTEKFFIRQERDSRSSAEVIVPLLRDLVSPRSVVDVGCGTGTWLSVFRQHGVSETHGFDNTWVDRRRLLIPQYCFTHADLSLPLSFAGKFDLVTSLEVAEHLPPDSATVFVETLTKLGDVIAFSAAAPFQGGDHHVNEQWPDYWGKRFLELGYLSLDPLRLRIWNDERVLFWYRQNLVLFVRESVLASYPKLVAFRNPDRPLPLALIHPRLYFSKTDYELAGVREMTRLWVGALARALRNRLSWSKANPPLAKPQPASI